VTVLEVLGIQSWWSRALIPGTYMTPKQGRWSMLLYSSLSGRARLIRDRIWVRLASAMMSLNRLAITGRGCRLAIEPLEGRAMLAIGGTADGVIDVLTLDATRGLAFALNPGFARFLVPRALSRVRSIYWLQCRNLRWKTCRPRTSCLWRATLAMQSQRKPP
jgi:hypothetical protein